MRESTNAVVWFRDSVLTKCNIWEYRETLCVCGKRANHAHARGDLQVFILSSQESRSSVNKKFVRESIKAIDINRNALQNGNVDEGVKTLFPPITKGPMTRSQTI